MHEKSGAVLLAIVLLCVVSCSDKQGADESGRPMYVATIQPLASILSEITGNRAEVVCLLKPGTSPHTYDATPSDAGMIENAKGLFHVHPMTDGWVAKFENPHVFEVFDFVPDELRRVFEDMDPDHGLDKDAHGDGENYDPHFWMSPKVVKSVVPKLIEALSEVDPDGASVYKLNGEKLIQKLDELDNEISEMLKPYAGEALLLFHPSFLYYMNDYGLEFAGVIEPFPGKEPTPKYLMELVGHIEEHNVKAIVTEPQLPMAPAETLAAETGLPTVVLDPLGGYEGRESYFDLIRYNTRQLVDVFSRSD